MSHEPGAGQLAEQIAGEPTAAPTFGRLLATEYRRLLSRRFVQAVAVLALVGFGVAVFAIFSRHDRLSPSELASATTKRDQQIAEIQQSIQQCSQGLSADRAAQQCGTAPTPQDFPIDQFLSVHPLQPGQVSD
ncbi:MAG: hypothetical protein ABI418_17940, partial [Jatrophihabitantaceae bacterium]